MNTLSLKNFRRKTLFPLPSGHRRFPEPPTQRRFFSSPTRSALQGFTLALALGASLLAEFAQAATLTWNVGGGGNWDTTTANWTGAATTFISNGSQDVIFNNTAGGSITISASMQPSSTTVSAASGTYTFNGGPITGSGGLTKSGAGQLTMYTASNTFTGKTSIRGGTLLTGGEAYLSNAGAPGVFGAPTGANATIDLYNGVTLKNDGSNPRVNQATNRPLNLAGTGAGTVSIKYNDNDAGLTFGAVTATGTGPKTLALFTGSNGNGDRQALNFTGAIADSSDGSPTSLNVTFGTQGSPNWVSLGGVNTFTGPITLTQIGEDRADGVLVVGGVRVAQSGDNAVGTGKLGNGNYPGAISLGTRTVLEYDSTAPQTLAGVISGAGAVTLTGGGTVTLSGINTYTGDTTVTNGTLILASTGGLKFAVTDDSNNKITGAGSTTLNGTLTVDTTAVTKTSGSWTLVDTTTKSFSSTFNLAGFSGPVGNVYTKVAGSQTWTFDKSTAVLALSSKAVITAFGIPGSVGVINQTNKTIALTVPYATNLATLAPTYALTSGSCVPASGTAPSPTFSNNLTATYVVTDGAVTNNYAVTVSKAAASSACDITACTFPGLGATTIAGNLITLVVPQSQPVNALSPTFTLSLGATISPLSGSSQNFTNSVSYTVTAENGSTTKTYTVRVVSYNAWLHSASFYILTDASGANLPDSASESNFPVLVKLNSGNFDFTQAQPDGSDIRFTTVAGVPLSYQIEQWDAANSTAAVWVKIPTITGNTRQELKMHWGKTGEVSESDGAAVFNASNGFTSVLHLNETATDVVGNTTPTDTGTTLTTGIVGKGRNFTAGNGILVGENLTNFPTGSSAHSSEVWIRPSAAGTNVLGWGIEQGQGKVVMQYVSPPHINMDCYFGGANVESTSTLTLSKWTHVAHTYQNGEAKIYVNGVLDGSRTGGSMNIPTPARMYIGGWGGYNYVGDMDEVRISNVTRSANWIRLEYQNQNPLQTLVGTLVRDGNAFSVGPMPETMNEGTTTTLTGQAEGAQKIYWIRVQNGQETVLAVDRFSLDFTADRISANQPLVIRFKAIYPTETKTADTAVTIVDTIPDPMFTLTAPNFWDGRQTITVTPDISNLATLQAAGGASLNYQWNVAGVAVTKQINPGSLTLTRAQGSGPLTVTLTMDNGGMSVSRRKIITIQEPATDAWVQRTPAATEKPVTGQFIAADDTRKGRIYYNGTQAGATSVFLRVYKTDSGSDVLYSSQSSLGSVYAFTAPIDAGLHHYKLVLSSSTGGPETVRETVTDIVCGDAYIIDGQSNAVAYDYYDQAATYPDLGSYTSTWIRTFGTVEGGGGGNWGMANTQDHLIGMWGMAMAKNLLQNYNIPICIINGAVGGTRIDQHQANPADHYAAGSRYSIYANLLTRVASAKLTHGIRGALWHQGEADLSNGGGGADWDYATYQQNFFDMSAAWKQDMPNLRHYYLFQVYAKGCGASGSFTSDMLRDMQRTLPRFYSHMSILPTLTYPTGANCHFNIPDYEQMGLSIARLVARDNYGLVSTSALTGPVLQRAWFTTSSKDEIALEFDQDMQWNAFAIINFYLNRVGGKVTSGSATGKIVRLQLNAPSTNTTIDYVVDEFWDTNVGNLLYGSNEIAALSFYGVPIASSSPTPYGDWATDPSQGLTVGLNDGPADDPDHDGLTNQQEFAFGLNPSIGTSANPITRPLDSATGRFQYTRRVGSGLTYRIFTSTNLGTWVQDTGATEANVTTSGDVQTVTVQVSTAPIAGKLFVRVHAQ